MTGTPGPTHGVQSVARAFEMLELMAAAGGTLGIAALAESTDLPPPTIHRLIRPESASSAVCGVCSAACEMTKVPASVGESWLLRPDPTTKRRHPRGGKVTRS